MREKFNLINELQKKSESLKGSKRLSLVGQGDFAGANNVMRSTMNIKHHTQALTIDEPEFPMIFDGKENVSGENSSFYSKTDMDYEVVQVIKKYDELLNGKCNNALYFLYNKKEDKYRLEERTEVENLVESFGFTYNNQYIDNCNIGDTIPKGTMITSSTSYDKYGNVSSGVNARILYGIHPAVQDDAITSSLSFAKRMMNNGISTVTIPITDTSLLLNLHGDENNYQGLPNIGDYVNNGILAATRSIKETRMFSDLRDSSLNRLNEQSDQIFYGNGEVIDINIYCNNPNIKMNKVNKQLIQYYNDSRWFYTEVYKTCKEIVKSGAKVIDKEINRWLRKSMDYLDTQAVWAFNDNIFQNIMIEILLRAKNEIRVGRKIVGRHGNKTVVCNIVPDEEMPYLCDQTRTDEYGVVHGVGVRERVELITNPLAIINRTIPMALYEPSITFILDRVRKHMNTLNDRSEQEEILFDVVSILNPDEGKEMRAIYDNLSEREKRKFMESSIGINNDGTLRTDVGIYIRWEPFNESFKLRDALIKLYDKYDDILQPYDIFVPKPKWGRDIHIGKGHIGYQYMLSLKQSGESGFSSRSAGSISDESLPEKTHENKIGKSWHASTPIRFGEYETPNFMIITDPNDFALMSALYRSSVDGRRFMAEAILSDDGEYDIPDELTSRSAEILQVYMKSLGIKIETVREDNYFFRYPENDEVVPNIIGKDTVMCSNNDLYYLEKMARMYRRYLKESSSSMIYFDELWDYIVENVSFNKKHLTDRIKEIFKEYYNVL